MAAALVVLLAVLALAVTCLDWRAGVAAQAVVVVAAVWQRRVLLQLAFLAEASYPSRAKQLLNSGGARGA